jgi:formylglycine-generating enzyme required for sulfatase activity
VVEVEPTGFEMVLVESGSFQMGSSDGRSSEQPVHTVNITKPFYIARYAVTIDQYDEFCEDTGTVNTDEGLADQPVGIIWYEVTAYCNWLSEQAGLDPCYEIKGVATRCDFAANGYRLPTEAEWEYAARGGPKSQGYTYAGSDDPDKVAWYEENSGGQVHPVGQKQPNELGLYDMSGNMPEWCWDWYVKDYYATSPSSDPTGPDTVGRGFMDRLKVCRGGSCLSTLFELRIAYRSYDGPDYRDGGSGIRLVRAA